MGQYPFVHDDKIEIEITNSQNNWNFNQFTDTAIAQTNNIPLFINNFANSNKTLNNRALDYYKGEFNRNRIRSEYAKVRLTNDKESRFKFIFNWLVNNQTPSTR